MQESEIPKPVKRTHFCLRLFKLKTPFVWEETMDGGYSDRSMHDAWLMKAHDVRDVSARICLAADELSQSTDPRTRLLGERLSSACERIVDICEDSTRTHVKKCQGSVAETLDMLVDLARYAAGPKTKLHVVVGCDAELKRDGVGLFRILANLINNAVTAVNRSGGGSVLIHSSERHGKLNVFVENSGTHTKDPGGTSSGLGLLIAQGLAQDIGAKLERLHQCPDGSVYALQLPHSMAVVPKKLSRMNVGSAAIGLPA